MNARQTFPGRARLGAAFLITAFFFGGHTLSSPAAPASPIPTFAHGVASGDPLPWAVVIWTRVTPVDEAVPGSRIGPPVVLQWEVATDAGFQDMVRSGEVTTTSATDHTAAVDVWGLTPGTEYYYRFRCATARSTIGRTRTAPGWWARVSSVRFGLVSCANWESGFFAGYRHLAARDDLDFILHVGDYIYEYAAGLYGDGGSYGRVHEPAHETINRNDYRRRYGQYRADPDLQALHARFAFITVWDDHEVANDTWRNGAQNHTPDAEGDFAQRRAQAYQAYFEWMPVRRPNPWFEPTRIYRRFVFGDLVDLAVLDLRQYRDEQVPNLDLAAVNDPDRTMAGSPQLGWLANIMLRSQRQWRVLANSVMFSPWQIPVNVPTETQRALARMKSTTPGAVPLYTDLWGGYAGERQRIVDFIAAAGIQNVVFLTGDIHSTFAMDVPLDPLAYAANPRTVAVEFVTPSITSYNINELLGQPPRGQLSITAEVATRLLNPWIKDVELDAHGFTVIDITRQRVRSETWHLGDRTDPESGISFYRGWLAFQGTSRLFPVFGPLGPR